jgi:ABC-type nitrate/sulfonate/bicarbonate transport system ATPase subunit
LNPILELKNITKYFNIPDGSKQVVLENLSFFMSDAHNITSILAPIGGGKSTLLKMISGLDNDYKGEILSNGTKKNNILPYIPEKPASFPWLDVESNIRLIFTISGKKGILSNNKLQELIELTGLTSYEKHYPYNKSYGFRFRITLARAMALCPPIILLDDSFKLMDSETKVEIFELIKQIASLKNIKFLFASSNITEVVMLSDKILLLKGKPCHLFGEIINEKNVKSLGQLKAEIHELLLKENAESFLFN